MNNDKEMIHVTYIPMSCINIEDSLKEITGIIKEEDLDLDDPIIAGILKKL